MPAWSFNLVVLELSGASWAASCLRFLGGFLHLQRLFRHGVLIWSRWGFWGVLGELLLKSLCWHSILRWLCWGFLGRPGRAPAGLLRLSPVFFGLLHSTSEKSMPAWNFILAVLGLSLVSSAQALRPDRKVHSMSRRVSKRPDARSRSRSPVRSESLRLATTGEEVAHGKNLQEACLNLLKHNGALTVFKLVVADVVVSPDAQHMPIEVQVDKVDSPSPKPGTLRFLKDDGVDAVRQSVRLGPESLESCGKVQWVRDKYGTKNLPEAMLEMVSCGQCRAFTTKFGALMQLWCEVEDEEDDWTCYYCDPLFDFHCGRCHAPIYKFQQDRNIRAQEEGRYWCADCSVRHSSNSVAGA